MGEEREIVDEASEGQPDGFRSTFDAVVSESESESERDTQNGKRPKTKMSINTFCARRWQSKAMVGLSFNNINRIKSANKF